MINLIRFSNSARICALSLTLIAVMILHSGCATTAQAKAAPKNQVRAAVKDGEVPPARPNTIYRMAKLMLAQGKEAEGELVLYNLIRTHPEFTPAYNDLAEIRMRQGRLDEATLDLSNGLAISPNDPVLLNNSGICALMKGSYDQALGYFENALEVAPREQRFQANTAAALALLGREAESLAAYRHVLSEKDAQFNMNVLSKIRENSQHARLDDALQLFKVDRAFTPEQGEALQSYIHETASAESVEEAPVAQVQEADPVDAVTETPEAENSAPAPIVESIVEAKLETEDLAAAPIEESIIEAKLETEDLAVTPIVESIVEAKLETEDLTATPIEETILEVIDADGQESIGDQARLIEAHEVPVADMPVIAAEKLAMPVQAETVPVSEVVLEIEGLVQSVEVAQEAVIPQAEEIQPVSSAVPEDMPVYSLIEEPGIEGKTEKQHTVTEGDTLASVAAEHGVDMRDLVRWNNLTQWWLEEDQKLTLYISE